MVAPSAECSASWSAEFAQAARVLVLELHPGRAVGIGFGGLRHAELLEARRARLGFRGELGPHRGLGAVAASGDDQREGALGIGEAEMQGGEAAHRQADDMGLVDLEGIEHGADVVAGARLRILRDVSGTSEGG